MQDLLMYQSNPYSAVSSRNPKTGKWTYKGQQWDIHPLSWQKAPESKSVMGRPVYAGDVSEHANAFVYYATWGLADPTNIADVPAWKVAGLSTPEAIGLAALRGFLGGGIIGWAIDPFDKRKGGWEETPLGEFMFEDPRRFLSVKYW